MCGICGMLLLNGATLTPAHKGMMSRLLLASEPRGKDATGLSFAKNKGVLSFKHNTPATDFVHMDGVKEIIKDGFDETVKGRLYSIIGHTRHKTKGTQENPDNNHPVKCGSMVGVHNGMIWNDDSIFEWLSGLDEKMKILRNAQVDTEAIFALVQHYADQFKDDYSGMALNEKSYNDSPVTVAIKNAVPRLRGSLACALQDTDNPKALWLFRNSSPISIWHYREEKTIVFASTPMILRAATAPAKFSGPVDIQLSTDQGICFNLETNKYNIFDIDTTKCAW